MTFWCFRIQQGVFYLAVMIAEGEEHLRQQKCFTINYQFPNGVDFCPSSCYINPYEKYHSISAKGFIVNLKIFRNRFLQLIINIILFEMISFGQEARDQVSGNLIQFNNNGAWCWYQDERAVVDVANGKLILGSDASGTGVGGSPRNGMLEAVVFDLQTGLSQKYELWKAGCDDHNVPGFIIRPDGKILAMYAEHYDRYNSRFRIFNGSAWSYEQRFDWTTIPGGTDYTIAYSNLYYLSAENRMYNFARANHRTPNFIISGDMGDTWSFGGELTTNSSNSYNKGYYKYCSNGVDRIDFIFTEQHPRDYNTSIYHGYVQGGKSYASDGTLADADIYDTQYIPTFAEFTLVFAANTVMNGYKMTRCWNTDVQRYDDGTIVTVITARTDDTNPPSNDPEHAFIYCRYNGSSWTTTYLGKAGKKMYYSEQDYTGLAAMHPNDPNIIYISTPIDPRDGTDLEVHEIFKGTTADQGATWDWTPITQKSVRDNYRLIVPAWDEDHTALLWWRGTYNAAQNFDAAVVGIIEDSDAIHNPKHYTDADLTNTTLSTGKPLITTGPDADQGVVDNQWHQRTGFGNGGSVLTSAEAGGENAPALKTQVMVSEAGMYDVWINFWANPAEDWRIKAGLSAEEMQLSRQMACKQVEDGDHDAALVLAGSGDTHLYQAYLGRVEVTAGNTFDVFVDDEAIRTGTQSTLIGGTARTWYDGISIACTDHDVCVCLNGTLAPAEFSLDQNYPNPFNPVTTISYSLSKNAYVRLKIVNLLGQEIATLINDEMCAGDYHITWNAENVPSGLYFYQLTAGRFSMMKKMILLK